MRLLSHPRADGLGLNLGDELDDDALAAVYAAPTHDWLRVNMVSTIDGAATGSTGKSGSINNAADKRIFDLLRGQADALLVGAGTLRIEEYDAPSLPLVAVSHRGALPEKLEPAERTVLVTHAAATELEVTRERIGDDRLLVLGQDSVDLTRLRPALAERGWRHILSEGGPHLLGSLLAAGVVDELCVTTTPMVVGGVHPRIVAGVDLEQELSLGALVEADHTLLARWMTGRLGS